MDSKSLLIVAGHAIWERGQWYGIEPNKFDPDAMRKSIEEHVQCGCDYVRSNTPKYDILVFSGGNSRPNNDPPLTNSEAAGMREYAESKGWLPSFADRIIIETFARDSFENIFFSMLAFRNQEKTWPSRIGIISMPHKSIRYMLMAVGLGIQPSQFTFHSIGSVIPLDTNCLNEMSNMNRVIWSPTHTVVDPLLRNEYFTNKRDSRTADARRNGYLNEVKAAYGNHQLIDQVENCDAIGGWKRLTWPWQVEES